MNKKKEDNTSVEVSKKQRKKGRLDGMLDAMNKRSDPLTTHKVATKYFSTFRSERHLLNNHQQSDNSKSDMNHDTTVPSPVATAIPTVNKTNIGNALDDINNTLYMSHSISENKVYKAIKKELVDNGVDEIRVGLKRLRELTKLSDKTIRIAIKSLDSKNSIIIRDNSKGVYGRLYHLPDTSTVIENRNKNGIYIDPTTKHIL